MSYLANTYSRFPIKVLRASGVRVWDEEGNEYIDTFMGIGVHLFGHNHPRIVEAMKSKLERYTHLSNFFLDEDAEYIAERLVRETGKDGKVFFTNSGAESTECALKVIFKVRKSGKILSFVRNFHGRTVAALSVTGFDHIRSQFVNDERVVFLPYDELSAERVLRSEEIAAVFLEVVHGSGGLDVLPEPIAEVVMEYKKSKGYIVVADEVQCGLGRTGTFYAYRQLGIEPDIVTLAKGLGGGLPLGACIMLGELADVFGPGEHGSTFAPNPVALAGGRAVLEMIDENTLVNARAVGNYLSKSLGEIGSVRGLGLMIGLELNAVREGLSKEHFLSYGLLVNIVSGNILRLLPPLNVTTEEADEITERLRNAIRPLVH